MGWLTEGLFGNDEGDGPQWPWAAKSWSAFDAFADWVFDRDQFDDKEA